MLIIESVLYTINFFVAVMVALFEKRDISAAWAWLLVMTLLPGIGIVLYLFLGRKLNKQQIFNLKTQEQFGIVEMADYQKKSRHNRIKLKYELQNELVEMFLNSDNAILTQQNDITIFTDGTKKFKQLFEDLRGAKNHINLEYFTIYDDDLGTQLREILIEKAKEGIKVRVLYDIFGSKGSKQRFFKELIAHGGEVQPFMQSKWRYLNFRINFRNHRKIVVIDGTIGYIGGFNVGDQYIGKNPRFGYWRDTHLRIVGSSVLQLQSRFFMDWFASAKTPSVAIGLEYFPQNELDQSIPMQIVSSGPESDIQKIKQGYIKMIMGARNHIRIETPYFIPDDALMETLLIALKSGLKIDLVIPNKPDHPFVYRATEYYARQLMEAGANVYAYQNGFMHVKAIVVDDVVVSLGSANWDIRSFKLNFEANAFIYHQDTVLDIKETINRDIKKSQKISPEYFNAQSIYTRFKQLASRLLSPLL